MAKKEKPTKEKPLEKLTATELRKMAMEIPDITGAHGMNKAELIKSIKAAKGIKEDGSKKIGLDVRETKQKIRKLKSARENFLEQDNQKMADVYRRRISSLKKKTRRA